MNPNNRHADQRSIRFDRYNGKTVVAVTGNYYAAYPEKIAAYQRARSTFLNVVMPILKSEVPRFQANQQVQGYALEISHHVVAEGHGGNGGKAGKPHGVFAAKRRATTSGLQG